MEKIREMTLRFARLIHQLSSIFEGIISVIILIAIVMETITMVDEFDMFKPPLSTVQMNELLGGILWLVIGLEFIKMLMEHSHAAVLEVMLFAIARQMIVDHTSMFENLMGVLAIAGVFAIRKFLYREEYEPEEARSCECGENSGRPPQRNERNGDRF